MDYFDILVNKRHVLLSDVRAMALESDCADDCTINLKHMLQIHVPVFPARNESADGYMYIKSANHGLHLNALIAWIQIHINQSAAKQTLKQDKNDVKFYRILNVHTV